MGINRRQAMLAGLGTLVLGGCATPKQARQTVRPVARWPRTAAYPHTNTAQSYTPIHPPVKPTHQASSPYPPQPTHTHLKSIQPTLTDPAIFAIARKNWAHAHPKRAKVNPMKGINKITVHHEGWKTVGFTDYASTAQRIEKIRTVHTRDRGWGDIGYHYIIDRAGRLWQGRPTQYQGAHVRQNNENNLGILVLGNFEKQRPTNAQLSALFKATQAFQKYYRVPVAKVRSHKEINPTSCPGKHLQKSMNALRQKLA